MKHIGLRSYIESSLHVALSLLAFCNVFAMQQGADLTVSLQCAIFGFGWVAYQYFHFIVPALVNEQRINLPQATLLFSAIVIGFLWTRHTAHYCLDCLWVCGRNNNLICTSVWGSNGLALYPYT
jgi:hypothetical protein